MTALIEAIFAHARAAPGRTAMSVNGQTYSYGRFAAAIRCARQFFEGAGVTPDRVAVLCLTDSFLLWSFGLALRSLGVDTVTPPQVADVTDLGLGQAVLVSSESEAPQWPDLAARAATSGGSLLIAPADLFEGVTSAPFGWAPESAAAPGGHILLTSGTTGAYKKVLNTDANDRRNIATRTEMFGFGPTSNVCLFNFGGWTAAGHRNALNTWAAGGAVVFNMDRRPWRAIATPDLTHAFLTPLILTNLLLAPAELDLRNDGLMLIVVAGTMTAAQWRAARERVTEDIRSYYGSTEAGGVTLTPVGTEADLPWQQPHPAYPIEVVDARDQPAPAGQAGTIRVRSTGVDDYLDDPDATRTFFRDGWFYPGDLGVFGPDGRFSLQGRVTDVINVLGDKIGVLPIETALQDALAAAAVCVFSTPEAGGEAVHVAIQPNGPITAGALRAALVAAMPRGLENVHVHRVDDFPRNHMGKIERSKVVAYFSAKPAAG